MAEAQTPSAVPQPEMYYTKPSRHCPNSPLPILVYRNVLPPDLSPACIQSAFEHNDWMLGGVFKAYTTHHFHSLTHEGYAALKGWAKCRYGVGPRDEQRLGVEFDMRAGDVAVHAAGVAHCHLEHSADYEYMGLYPKGSPHWDNNFCQADEQETRLRGMAARKVPLPDFDPVYGRDGPLVVLWRKVVAEER